MKYFKIIFLIFILLSFINISKSIKNTNNNNDLEKYNIKINSYNSDSTSSNDGSYVPTNNLLSVSAFVTFSGGKVLCNSSSLCPKGYDYVDHYACSYEILPGIPRGNWDKGIKYFRDPFEFGENVDIEAVSFTITGTVGCSGDNIQTELAFLIHDYQIGGNTTNIVTDCSCGTCVLTYSIDPQRYSGLGFNRTKDPNHPASNKFQLQVLNNATPSPTPTETPSISPSVPPTNSPTVTPSVTPTDTPTVTPTSTPNNNNKNLSPQEKKYIIMASAITGGLLIIIFTFVFIRKCLKKRKKADYIRIKDGKDIDIHQIKLGKRIGKGNFGEVYLGTWRGSKVAIKKLPAHNINENVLKEFHREIELMKNLRHPNVIQFLGSCTISPDICICTEYMERGSLYSILHDPSIIISWELVKRMMTDAAKGIIYLHGSNPVILHRDLKSHNLLVEEDFKVKVADFGLSAIEQKAHTMTSCGTPSWTSPEILRGQRYTDKADVYSFGIILWECATRQDPYAGIPPFQVIFAVGREGLRPPIPKVGPPKYIQLIIDCLNENPNHRPSMEQVLERLEEIDTDPSIYPDIEKII
ncbi:hypothetical protein DICPUDRAFT_159186 [Dictyostelium purpureum]|uniref:non-specific serine/threonine protein kinase n=1 Tax=Dictyostelium purpureum TaxID=5786 RepID=F1A3H6_DICPU|nr:uncharacterized protein DICPUDRAFT_159186 [Dictyostelium purpureum]EGC29254.1 hypothetical protein DICPUDRAFT_159186 [Dictyostelium purpureum]|eukprot:XP_003294223.1 hypothetical protein DICPUDRAFT_159186 [Dictyostelium purpureum]